MFVKGVRDGDSLMELWRFNELVPKKTDQAQGSSISPCSPTANYALIQQVLGVAQEPGDFNVQPGPRNTALRVPLDVSPPARLRAHSYRTQNSSLAAWESGFLIQKTQLCQITF